MSAGDVTALVFAIIALAIAMSAVVTMWRRGRRRRRAVRSRHPSSRPPLSISTVELAGGRHFRIDVARSAPTMAIDIVSFQQVGSADDWDSEPLIDPLVIQPGGFAVLTSELPKGAADFDVVVAWTAQHPIGEVQGSLLYRLPRGRGERVRGPAGGPSLPAPFALALLLLLALSAVLIVAAFLTSGDDDDDAAAADADVSVPVTAQDDADTQSLDAETTATTTAPPSAAPISTTPSVPPTSTPVSSTDAAVEQAGPVPIPPPAPEVTATATVAECRFGSDCLIVDFTIDGFDPRPQEYICEFDDGSRFSFSFDSDGVESACSSSSADAEITVEVDGVRSATLSRTDA